MTGTEPLSSFVEDTQAKDHHHRTSGQRIADVSPPIAQAIVFPKREPRAVVWNSTNTQHDEDDETLCDEPQSDDYDASNTTANGVGMMFSIPSEVDCSDEEDEQNDGSDFHQTAEGTTTSHDDETDDYPAELKTSRSGTPYVENVRLLTQSFLFEHPSLDNSRIVPADVAVPIDVSTVTVQQDDVLDSSARRPAFVTVTCIKATRETPLGLFVAPASKGVMVTGFAEDVSDVAKAVAMSPLGVGDVFLSIDDKRCAGLTADEVENLLAQAVGPVTISIQNHDGDPSLVETMVEKPFADCLVGLGFRQTFHDGGFVQVTKVAGLFTNSFVQRGDRVVMVNGRKATSMSSVTQTIATAPRFVSLTVASRTGVLVPSLEVESKCGCTLM